MTITMEHREYIALKDKVEYWKARAEKLETRSDEIVQKALKDCLTHVEYTDKESAIRFINKMIENPDDWGLTI